MSGRVCVGVMAVWVSFTAYPSFLMIKLYFMKKKNLFFVLSLAMALVGCNTNDEVVGGPQTESFSGVNSVSFTNNTSLVIGESQTGSRLGISRVGMNVNAATNLKFEASLADYLSSKGVSSSSIYTVKESTLDKETCDFYYENGIRYIYVSEGVVTIDFDLNYANSSASSEEPALTFLIDKNAELKFNGDADPVLDRVEILSWGTLTLPREIKVTESVIKIAGDCSVGNEGTINMSNSSLYVGGDLTGAILADKSIVYVGGTMNYETTDYRSCEIQQTSMYVADALNLQNLSINGGSDFDTNCKLTVSNELQVNNSELAASSIKAKKAIFVDAVTWLLAKGAAEVETMQIQGTNAFHIYGEGSTLISCYQVNILNENALANLSFDSGYYLNSKSAFFMLEEGIPSFEDKVNYNVDGVGLTGSSDGCFIDFEVPGTPSYTDDADVELTIPTDIAAEEWFLKADDFAIRVDGKYQDVIQVENGVTALEDIRLTEENLKIAVKGVANLEVDKDYTYEVWLWVDEKTWLETFTDADRAAWISGDGEGTDITQLCTIVGPEGYTLRSNVYKGVSGHADTPYIKVSIHITKDKE